MPWHSHKSTNAGLTSDVGSVWSLIDADSARNINVPKRRTALNSVGARISTAHQSAEWSEAEHQAIRQVFDRFDVNFDHAISVEELGPALRLLGLSIEKDEAANLVKEFDVNRSGKLELGEVCYALRCCEPVRCDHVGAFCVSLNPHSSARSSPSGAGLSEKRHRRRRPPRAPPRPVQEPVQARQ